MCVVTCVMACVVACSSSSKPPAAGETAPADAGSAATPEGGASAHAQGTWCADRTEGFCEDFDTSAFTSKAWVASDTTGERGAGLPPGALDTTSFLSAPNAFAAKTPAIAGAATERLYLQGSAPGPDAVHVEADFAFSLRAAALGAGPRIEVARVEGVNPITFASYGVVLILSASGASLELVQGSQGSNSHALAAAPKTGAWSRVSMHLVLERTVNGPATTVAIQIDASPAETFSIERGMGVRPFLRLGLVVTGPSAPCEVAFDNVTYDAR